MRPIRASRGDFWLLLWGDTLANRRMRSSAAAKYIHVLHMQRVGRAHLGKHLAELRLLPVDCYQSDPSAIAPADADGQVLVGRQVNRDLFIAAADDLVAEGEFALEIIELLLPSVLLCANPIDVNGMFHVQMTIRQLDVIADVVAVGAPLEAEQPAGRIGCLEVQAEEEE